MLRQCVAMWLGDGGCESRPMRATARMQSRCPQTGEGSSTRLRAGALLALDSDCTATYGCIGSRLFLCNSTRADARTMRITDRGNRQVIRHTRAGDSRRISRLGAHIYARRMHVAHAVHSRKPTSREFTAAVPDKPVQTTRLLNNQHCTLGPWTQRP